MSIGPKELAREARMADDCCGTITRGGEMYACEKPAVAIVRGTFEGDEFYWPACAWHVNRYGPGVPLVDIVAALEDDLMSSAGLPAPANWPEGEDADRGAEA